MKILLIQPNTQNIVANLLPDYVSREVGVYPPLGLMYLAASIEKHTDFEVEILDCILLKPTEEDFINIIQNKKPHMVGISATTVNLVDVVNLANTVRLIDNSIHICIGGPHTSTYPMETINMPCVDSLVYGEGEQTIIELTKALAKNQSLEGIKGLIFKDKNGAVKNNGPRPYIENLDTIEIPARHKVDHTNYKSIIGQKHIFTTALSSRGCPFNCIYCYHAFGKAYRKHSVSYMMQEIHRCIELGIKEIWYFDDNFSIDKKRTLAFCDTLINENCGITWHMRTRIDLLNRELAEKLRKAGCKRISIGIESGEQKVIDTLRKEIDLSTVKEKIRMLKKLGVEVYLDFMIGSPGEKREDVLKTIAFAIELDPDYVQFAITTPYPATDLYKYVFDKKLADKDYWKEFAEKPYKSFKTGLVNENMSREELLHLMDRAYRNFYFRPKYIVRRLLDIKSPDDLLFKARAALNVFSKVRKA